MRNPDRIGVILDALEQAWRKQPDLRLTQLLVICAATQRTLGPDELFYIEDDVTFDGIKAYLSGFYSGDDRDKDVK